MTPRKSIWLISGLALTLLFTTGCFQVVKLISVSLGNLSAVNGAASAGKYINLEDESDVYADHKDKFSDVSDVAVLGRFKNNLGAPVSADVWIVTNPSSPALLPDLAAVQAAGGKKLWSMTLAANETKTLTWDNSAAQFTTAGKTALKQDIEDDGIFALYVFGSTGTYDITLTNGQFAVMIYIGALGP